MKHRMRKGTNLNMSLRPSNIQTSLVYVDDIKMVGLTEIGTCVEKSPNGH